MANAKSVCYHYDRYFLISMVTSNGKCSLSNAINIRSNMKKIIISEAQLKKIIESQTTENYMFFGNLQQIHRQCEMLMKMNPQELDNIIKNGHDWADDHVSEAKNNMDQVFDFLMNKTERTNSEPKMNSNLEPNMDTFSLNENEVIDESKNKPNNPKLWAASLAWAKSKYKVCPSAYCNGAASKRYKSKGGTWRKKVNESVNESKKNNDDVYHKSYTSAVNAALEYAEKKGYTYDQEEVASEIGLGPKKPKEGDTNRFTISLKKDDKEQKKALHIQIYGMKEKYELNCYIN